MREYNVNMALSKAQRYKNNLETQRSTEKKYNCLVGKYQSFRILSDYYFIAADGKREKCTKRDAEDTKLFNIINEIPVFYSTRIDEDFICWKNWLTIGNDEERYFYNSYPKPKLRYREIKDFEERIKNFSMDKIKNTVTFLRHLANGHEDKDVLVEILARMVQYPKLNTPIVLLMSGQGTGKTTFFESILKPIFGDAYKTIDDKSLSNHFNGFIEHPVLGCEESKDTRTINNIIKAISGSNYKVCEHKGKDATEIQITNHLFMVTNNTENPTKIEEDDRRFLVLEVPKIKEQNANLSNLIKKEMIDFFVFLATYDIDYRNDIGQMGWTREELATEAKNKIKDNAREINNEIRMVLYNAAQDNGGSVIFQLTALANFMHIDATLCKKALTELGMKPQTHRGRLFDFIKGSVTGLEDKVVKGWKFTPNEEDYEFINKLDNKDLQENETDKLPF